MALFGEALGHPAADHRADRRDGEPDQAVDEADRADVPMPDADEISRAPADQPDRGHGVDRDGEGQRPIDAAVLPQESGNLRDRGLGALDPPSGLGHRRHQQRHEQAGQADQDESRLPHAQLAEDRQDDGRTRGEQLDERAQDDEGKAVAGDEAEVHHRQHPRHPLGGTRSPSSEKLAGPVQASPTPTPARKANRLPKPRAKPHIAVATLHRPRPMVMMPLRLPRSA